MYSDPVSGCGDPAGDWPGIFEDVLGAPVVLRSYGPTAAAKLPFSMITKDFVPYEVLNAS